MEIRGSRRIAAARPVVWAALNDPAVMQAAIPGCTSFAGSAETGFDAVVSQRIGPIGATFEGRIALSDVIPLERYTLTGSEKGATTGRAHGKAAVTLADADGGTALDYTVTVHVGGRLAKLGSRVIGAFAAKLADLFFGNFQQIVEGGPAETPARGGWLNRLTKRGA